MLAMAAFSEAEAEANKQQDIHQRIGREIKVMPECAAVAGQACEFAIGVVQEMGQHKQQRAEIGIKIAAHTEAIKGPEPNGKAQTGQPVGRDAGVP